MMYWSVFWVWDRTCSTTPRWEACVVVCRMDKPPERQQRVLFINAVNEFTRERAQSFLKEDHI